MFSGLLCNIATKINSQRVHFHNQITRKKNIVISSENYRQKIIKINKRKGKKRVHKLQLNFTFGFVFDLFQPFFLLCCWFC